MFICIVGHQRQCSNIHHLQLHGRDQWACSRR